MTFAETKYVSCIDEYIDDTYRVYAIDDKNKSLMVQIFPDQEKMYPVKGTINVFSQGKIEYCSFYEGSKICYALNRVNGTLTWNVDGGKENKQSCFAGFPKTKF